MHLESRGSTFCYFITIWLLDVWWKFKSRAGSVNLLKWGTQYVASIEKAFASERKNTRRPCICAIHFIFNSDFEIRKYVLCKIFLCETPESHKKNKKILISDQKHKPETTRSVSCMSFTTQSYLIPLWACVYLSANVYACICAETESFFFSHFFFFKRKTKQA